MSRINTPAETLRQLRDQIGDARLGDAEVRQVLLSVFADPNLKFGYTPYRFQYDLLNRATKNTDENWFSDPDGNPLIERMHCPAPPADRKYTFKRSRCNRENKSMFYGATETGVPIFEVQPTEGYFVVVSTWAHKSAILTADNRPSQSIDGLTIALGVEQIMRALNADAVTDKDLYELLFHNEPSFSPSTQQDFLDVDKYIGEVFAEKGSDEVYQFTSTLSDILFTEFRHSSGVPIDGLIYPSVESQASGHNIVLNAGFARDTFKLWRAEMYYVQEHDVHQSKFGLRKIKSIEHDPTGNYTWAKVNSADEKKLFWLSPATERVSAESIS